MRFFGLPRGVWIAIGMTPVIALFALLVWGISRPNVNPGSLAVFDSSGDVDINERPAADFTLNLFDGSQVHAGDLRGKWVMVDFWASWCPPCRAEADTLELVWRQYRDRGVVFVGVDIWDRDDRALDFLAEHDTTYTVGVDPRGELAVEFGVTGIPEKYFIDPQGVLVRKFVGPMSESRLTRILDDLLAQGSDPPSA